MPIKHNNGQVNKSHLNILLVALTWWKRTVKRLFSCSSRFVHDFFPAASTTIHKHCAQQKEFTT